MIPANRIVTALHILLCLTALSIGMTANAQKKSFTLSGNITNSQSHESLIAASVYDIRSQHGAISNEYGFFSLTLPAGPIELHVAYVGYKTFVLQMDLQRDTMLNIRLDASTLMEEITVRARGQFQGAQSQQIGAVEIPVGQLLSTPVIFGEKDIIKVLQLLPGVAGGTEGSAGMYVRGGGPDENLLLLDGVPVYNINHLCGFFSVFNPDAVKNVTLFKGSFPARYAGRLSSIIDVRSVDGDMYNYHGNVSIGVISSKISLEGPIWKGRTSFSVSARRTYADLLATPLIAYFTKQNSSGTQEETRNWAGYYFYDLNVKLNHRFSDTDRLFASFYMGDDRAHLRYRSHQTSNSELNQKQITRLGWNWGNLVSCMRWNHIISPKLFMDASATFTRYRHSMSFDNKSTTAYHTGQTAEAQQGFTSDSGIYDLTAKVDFDYSPRPNHSVRYGAAYIHHRFRPDVTSVRSSSSDTSSGETTAPTTNTWGNNKIDAHETALYIEDSFSLGERFKANAGLHYSTFTVERHFYHSLQPRLSMRLMLTDNFSFKAGYAYMSQYVHMLSNSNIALPTDLWVPVTKHIAPMQSHQFTAGLFYDIDRLFDISVEAYYKPMNNLLEYKDGSSFMASAIDWQERVAVGRGWAYGVEVLLQRTIGKTTGWIGYTWSKAQRQFDREGQNINFGKPFYAKYDRRHDVSITVSHRFNDRIDVGATWVYNSGTRATLAVQSYNPPDGTNFGHGPGSIYEPIEYIPERNNYLMPAYHRLDVGANFHKKKRHGTRTWSVSIYNVYNRKNAFAIWPDNDYNSQTGQQETFLSQATLFPIIPSVSYSYKF